MRILSILAVLAFSQSVYTHPMGQQQSNVESGPSDTKVDTREPINEEHAAKIHDNNHVPKEHMPGIFQESGRWLVENKFPLAAGVGAGALAFELVRNLKFEHHDKDDK